uniref:CSON005158 protein n=1 Tax=Culicoides sonorensis TaxID=179676 RepID=A0A336N2F5_CULSO
MAGRSHKKSNHRWSSKEIEAFLAAIKDELGGNKHKFEKPTAPIFYENIKNRVPDLADMTHLHLKNKFNYLKKSYMNAVNWKNSTGVGTLTEGETIEDRLLLMCKYFHELDEILSGKKNVNPPRIVDTLLEQPELEENNFNNLEDIIVEEHYGEDEDVENILASTDAISDEPVPVENLRRGRSLSPLGEDSVAPKPKRQRGAQSGPAYALLKMQEQRLESEKIRTEQQINVEKEKINIEQGKLDLERDKMTFERTKFETEMELKQKEMDQQLKLKELELEYIIVEEHYGEDEDVENILASTDAISDEPIPVENLRRGRSLSPLAEDSVTPKPKRQRGAQSGPAYALLKMQEQRLESEKIRTEQQVNVEKEKITIEQGKLDLERDKMAFERTKFETEMELKQKEMEQQLKLKELEMECEERKLKMKLEFEERIKIYELELAAKSKK